MAEGEGAKKWSHYVGSGFRKLGSGIASVTGVVFRNLSGVRGLTGILFVGSFLATVFAAWRYGDSTFGEFSKTLGVPITSVFVGLWAADYYYQKDAYKKRYRDVEVSVYTTWLLMVGVETIRKHLGNAKTGVGSFAPNSDDQHGHKLTAHSEIEAGHTAAELTIKMAYLALTNLSNFSAEAVKAGKDKFTTDEYEAGIRQQIIQGGGHPTPATDPTQPTAATGNGSGSNG